MDTRDQKTEHGSETASEARLLTELNIARRQLAEERQRSAQMLSARHQELLNELSHIRTSEQKLRQETVEAFRNSASWRITAPLRAATSALRRLSGASVPEGEPAIGEVEGKVALPVGPNAKDAMRAGFRTRLDVFLTCSGKLVLPSHSEPDVSILLVLYNQAELTYACLSSIAEVTNGSELKVEVIIVDNGSTDATHALLDKTTGATIIRSPDNLHFLRGANRAAQTATGKYLLFLNNDALLLPGSIEVAVSRSVGDAGIGAIGGRIVLPDGTLQEAGSIVWADGTCTGYGRGGLLDAAEFMYRRDVDYCSGAFLLTPRALFETFNGFDERYAPAYYEETDYCLRLWESGWRVVFDPDIVIVHHEFGSSSNSEQALELQRRNSGIFRERHAEWLVGQLPYSPGNLTSARSTQNGAKRILMLEDRVPHSRLGAGYPRSNELLRELVVTGAELTLFPMFHHPETWEGIRKSVPEAVEVMYGSSAANLQAFLDERRGYYDAILVCRPHNMQAFLKVAQSSRDLVQGTRVFYDAEALFASRKLLEHALANEEVSADRAAQMLSQEIELTRPADAIISVSLREKAQFEAHGVGPVHILGHTIEPRPTPAPFHERTDLLFVGAIHQDDAPNADSLRWFAADIWPRLKELGIDLHLKVVGINRASSIAALEGRGLELIGSVDDLAPWFDRARVVIAPTRIAAGIPLKVYEAAAHGVPTVTTDLLATLLGWQPGRDLLTATSASEFAESIARLFHDRQLWEAVRSSALERVTNDCSRARFRHTVAELVESIPSKRPQLRRPIASEGACTALESRRAGLGAETERSNPGSN